MLPPTKIQLFKIPYESGGRAIWMFLTYIGAQFEYKDEEVQNTKIKITSHIPNHFLIPILKKTTTIDTSHFHPTKQRRRGR